jgi:hypothetical protein
VLSKVATLIIMLGLAFVLKLLTITFQTGNPVSLFVPTFTVSEATKFVDLVIDLENPLIDSGCPASLMLGPCSSHLLVTGEEGALPESYFDY